MVFKTNQSFIFLLFILYFLQGLPYGLQVKLLPVLLRSQSFSLSSVSFIRLLSIPWLCKALWAPLIDRTSSVSAWLMYSLFGIAVVFMSLVLVDFSQVGTMIVVLLCLNILTASQDIAVDSLAISLLKNSDLGHGNIAQVVGFKVGALVGGGALVMLNSWLSWHHIFALVSCLYLIVIAVLQISSIMSFLNQSHSSTEGNEKYAFKSLTFFKTFKEVFKVPGTPWLAGYVLVYKLGEQGLVSMFPLSLMDSGMPLRHVSMITGMLGQLFSITGSVLGGMLISNFRFGIVNVLFTWSTLRLLPIITQLTLVHLQSQNMVVIATSECFLQLCAGVVTTATFTLMMSCSQLGPSNIQVSHYTTLVTFEVLGKLVMTSISGFIVDSIGYLHFSVVCLLLSLIVLIVLKYVPFCLGTYIKKKVT